jgi:hypothetical protein
MTITNSSRGAALLALGALALSATAPTQVWAQTPAVDPVAVQILKKATDYLGGLQQFSVDTLNILEEVLDSGQKIQVSVAANVVLQRPNKLRAERKGDLINQSWYYDGKTLAVYNSSVNYYASEPAPGTIEDTLDFARDSLGLIIPASDLVYRNAFPLLMQDVTFAAVVGKARVGSVMCDHLLFSRPGVDFQIWVPEAGKPLPLKYVVVDTGVPELVATITLISNWNVAPKVTDALFTFVPPQGSKKTEFMPPDSWSTVYVLTPTGENK